jgi:hypothetical protein
VQRALGQLTHARATLEAASAWHHEAGGGEQARLGACLLAALDAADEVPGAQERLTTLLGEARRADDAAAEVFALDSLARLAAASEDAARARHLIGTADRRMKAASHFITERDRTDARWVRQPR